MKTYPVAFNYTSMLTHRDAGTMLRNYDPKYNILACKCPKCHTLGSLRGHGSYTRWFRSSEDKEMQHITVKRAICKGCGQTSALLPKDCVPYQALSVSVQLNICKAKLQGKHVLEICERFDISKRTLYRIAGHIHKTIKIFVYMFYASMAAALTHIQHTDAFTDKFLHIFGRMPFENVMLSHPPDIHIADLSPST